MSSQVNRWDDYDDELSEWEKTDADDKWWWWWWGSADEKKWKNVCLNGEFTEKNIILDT